jgi:hypothetical protein
MKAQFEVKYLDITWYDKNTLLNIKESFIPLKVEYNHELQRFICDTILYPKAEGIRNGQLAFRYTDNNQSEPYFETADGKRVVLKKVIDKDSGKTWWIEGNAWIDKYKCWESKAHRTAGTLLVGLNRQICQVNIGSSEFTAPQLERYLADFKNDLWELILDEESYITANAKKIQNGGINEDSINLINNMLSHAQQLLKKPKSELREIQTLKPRKMVKPVTRTFMELTTKGDSRFLTSRATKPSYNVPENRYILFVLERIYRILKQLVTVSKSKINRFEDTIEKLNTRFNTFSNEKLIDKNLVRSDLEKLKLSYNLDSLNHSLEKKLKSLNYSADNSEPLSTWYLKIGNKTDRDDGYFIGIKSNNGDCWFDFKSSKQTVILRFNPDHYHQLFERFVEYKITANVKLLSQTSKNGTPYHIYTLNKLTSIRVIGGSKIQQSIEKFQSLRLQAIDLNSKKWIKKLSSKELTEQNREKNSIHNQIKFYKSSYEKTTLVFTQLEPKLIKYKKLLLDLKQMDIKPLSTFPNSMTFVQNPNYQFIHSGYKKIRELTNLSDDDLLLSLDKIEKIGLINMPLLYERWCLLQIIKVLVQNFHYVPSEDWKRKLLRIVSTGRHNESINFTNPHLKRSIKLWYEPTLKNGRTPDFVLDVTFQKKCGSEKTKRLVMDAKFYSDELLKRWGGISKVINTLYHEKNYSEDGKNGVFILHPAKNAIIKKVSPQSWGKNSYLGELKMFEWDQPLRSTHNHKYGAICANPILRLSYLDEFQRLIGMFLQYGIEDNKLNGSPDDVESLNFCIACGSHELKRLAKNNNNSRSSWYECNICKHFTTYNHCNICDTRLIKNGDYWSYHSQMPMEPLNIKCPTCESLL